MTGGDPDGYVINISGKVGSRKSLMIHDPSLTTGCIVVEVDDMTEIGNMLANNCAESSCPFNNVIVKIWYDLPAGDRPVGNLGGGNTSADPGDAPPGPLRNRHDIPEVRYNNCNCP
jgi:hypothetical protein